MRSLSCLMLMLVAGCTHEPPHSPPAPEPEIRYLPATKAQVREEVDRRENARKQEELRLKLECDDWLYDHKMKVCHDRRE